MYARYAVFYTPEGYLAQAGAEWLGWDITLGQPMTHPGLGNLDVAAVTQTPRKYGMHGTIKPPFVLAPGKTPENLQAQTRALCEVLAPVDLGRFELVALGRFLALVPRKQTDALGKLAADVVTKLDAFRAKPMPETELARRRKANLTPEQDAHLVRWGYPYVLDQFKFHITLTSKLPKTAIGPTLRWADAFFCNYLDAITIDSLTLVGQRPDGMFEEIERLPLLG